MKRIIAIALVIAMAFCLAACGDSEKSTLTGVYTSVYLGEDWNLVIDKKNNIGFQLACALDDEDLSKYGLDSEDGFIVGSFKEGENGRLYFIMADDTDDEFGLMAYIAESLFTSPVTYDSEAEVLLVNNDGTEIVFVKTEDEATKLYTVAELQAMEDKAEKDEVLEDSEDIAETEVEETAKGADPVDEPEEPEPEETPITMDTYWDAVDDFLDNPIKQGWAIDADYLYLIAVDDSSFYWVWAAGGAGGSVVQSMSDPYDITQGGYTGMQGSETSLLNAIYTANGNNIIEFTDIAFTGYDYIEYKGETYEGEVWVYKDSKGETSYTYVTVPYEYDPEEWDETLILKEGQPWIALDPMEGWPYIDSERTMY